MDKMMGRARFLGRAAVLGAATFATLLAAGTAGVAASRANTDGLRGSARAQHGPCHRESFILPAGTDAIKVSAGSTKFTVTRPAGVSPDVLDSVQSVRHGPGVLHRQRRLRRAIHRHHPMRVPDHRVPRD